jgi:hypothetical protein
VRPLSFCPPYGDTSFMTSFRRTLERVLRGPVGGMFLCLLIAGFLGGVAVAHPSDKNAKGSTSEETSSDPTDAPEAPEQDQGSESQGSQVHSSAGGGTTHTAADCQASLTGVQSALPAAQDATGLAHAIWVVEANCEKNPQAPGLVNALDHLVANWQRHQDHAAEKASGEHGPPADHGNSGEHGKSGEHGNSAEHGNSGEHGNSSHGSSSGTGAGS